MTAAVAAVTLLLRSSTINFLIHKALGEEATY